MGLRRSTVPLVPHNTPHIPYSLFNNGNTYPMPILVPSGCLARAVKTETMLGRLDRRSRYSILDEDQPSHFGYPCDRAERPAVELFSADIAHYHEPRLQCWSGLIGALAVAYSMKATYSSLEGHDNPTPVMKSNGLRQSFSS